MAAITYTAKRSIITRPFSVNAVSDVSVSDVDNSFNSGSIDLSGLLTDEWVYVTGFANVENNGWHQLTVDAVTGKITTGSTLVTEAVGAVVSMQGYLHGEGEQYELEVDLRSATYFEEEKANTNKSLSGKEEKLLHHWLERWACTTAMVDELADKVYWQEFLHSVRANEPFTFDVYGSIATPDDPFSAKLVGVPTWPRKQNLKKLHISFVVEKLA